MMNYTEFQESLRAAVRAKRGAQAEIARRLGISTPSVAAYVTGGNRIPAEHLDVVLDVLGASVDLQGLVRSGPLTPENLTQTDPALGMAAVFSDGVHRMSRMRPADLAATVLGPVPPHLPPDVRHHLDQGRACIAYAGFFYPLLAVGAGQLAMAVEAAIRAYAKQVKIDTTVGTKGRTASIVVLTDRLASAGHFDAHQVKVWKAWSNLRNGLTHPGDIQILPLGLVLPLLTDFTEEILRLFPTPVATEEGSE